MCNLNASCGETANGSTSAPSIWNWRSGIAAASHCRRAVSQRFEEGCNLLPHLGTAGKAAPVAANQAYQPEALIDRQQVIFIVAKTMSVTDAVCQQGFHICVHLLKLRIGVGDFVPRLQRE